MFCRLDTKLQDKARGESDKLTYEEFCCLMHAASLNGADFDNDPSAPSSPGKRPDTGVVPLARASPPLSISRTASKASIVSNESRKKSSYHNQDRPPRRQSKSLSLEKKAVVVERSQQQPRHSSSRLTSSRSSIDGGTSSSSSSSRSVADAKRFSRHMSVD